MAVVRVLTTCNALKGNVSTTRSCYFAKLSNLDITTSLKKGDLRLGRRGQSCIPDQVVNQRWKNELNYSGNISLCVLPEGF